MSVLLLIDKGQRQSASFFAAISEVPVRGARLSEADSCAHCVRVTLQFAGSGRRVRDRHLRVMSPAPHPWPLLADVLVAPGADAAEVDGLAAGHPGAGVAAGFRDTGEAWLRLGPYGYGGPLLSLSARHVAGVDWDTWASLAHTWLVAGLPPAALGSMTVRATARRGSPGQEPDAQPEAPSPSPSSRSRPLTPLAASGRPAAR